jgi:hypothetical protein
MPKDEQRAKLYLKLISVWNGRMPLGFCKAMQNVREGSIECMVCPHVSCSSGVVRKEGSVDEKYLWRVCWLGNWSIALVVSDGC